MRRALLVSALGLAIVACSAGSGPTSSHSPASSPVPSARPTASPSSSPSSSPAPVPVANSYGLLMVSGYLELITPAGDVGPMVTVAPSSVQACSAGLNALLAPPVSATADKVFYRDGDNNIRFVTPNGTTGDSTTLPGGASAVSFFSVSPDDLRIAVLVEDLSRAGVINIRLYVEDLAGGGHHADIYTATTSKSAAGVTLWPLGWHQGQLVLAVMPACGNDAVSQTPSEWHVADPATGNRVATIACSGTFSKWPSAAGVACEDSLNRSVRVFDWSGRVFATTQDTVIQADPSLEPARTGVSPSGAKIFFASKTLECNEPCPVDHTDINASYTQGYLRYGTQYDYLPACLWIDETHLLAPDTTLTLVLSSSAPPAVGIAVRRLPAKGECAGRFPGGL